MKKLAIGCLAIALLAGAATAGVVYYGYLKVRSAVSQFAELGRVPEIERGIRVKTPFTPPPSGELTADQVERLVHVQTRVRERLGQDFAAFERQYKTLADKKDATVVDAPALIAAYRDMAAGWLNAKRAQVDALNDANMSLAEYRWVRIQAYRALDLPFFDVDFARLAQQARAAGTPLAEAPIEGGVPASGPAANRKLVERYRKQLQDSIAMASFGL
jgi:hypothetical protein